MKKILLLIFLIAIVYGAYVYYKTFIAAQKDPNALQSKNILKMEAQTLYNNFNINTDSANKLYLDKTIEVQGKVKDIEQNNNRYTVYIDAGNDDGAISCEMDTMDNEKLKKINKGESISITGFCNGFLVDVSLDKCKISNK